MSKLLRSATLMGKRTESIITDFLASHQSTQLLPEEMLRDNNGNGSGGASARLLGGNRASLGISPTVAAAAAAAAVEARIGNDTNDDGAGSRRVEQIHLQRLNQMQREREVDLPVERARAIIRSVQGGCAVVDLEEKGAYFFAADAFSHISDDSDSLLTQEQAAASGLATRCNGPFAGRGGGMHAGHAAPGALLRLACLGLQPTRRPAQLGAVTGAVRCGAGGCTHVGGRAWVSGWVGERAGWSGRVGEQVGGRAGWAEH